MTVDGGETVETGVVGGEERGYDSLQLRRTHLLSTRKICIATAFSDIAAQFQMDTQ